ncbi:MAG TPA: hypothetical protein VLF68_02535 [Candidatus Saccharimonadales bacterium]|nr:hypothetical protein [Candidatus Saccharimonadales bacterium]
MKKLLWIYPLFLLLFAIFSFAFVDQNLIYLKRFYSGFALDQSIITSLIYAGFIAAFFSFYFFILHLIRKNKTSVAQTKKLIGASVLLLFSYPAMLSYDIFNYIATAKVLFFYHENPYVVMPIAFAGDRLLLFTRAANKIALYGPTWIFLSGVPFFAGLGNFLLTLFAFKLTVFLFYIAACVLLWKMTKNLFALSLFALNPLVIIETLVSGHNDIVVMFFALLSFYFLQKKKLWLAVIIFVAGILIKYSTVFLIPVFVYLLWKTFRKKQIDWEKIFYFSFLSMLLIFLLSFVREEIYSWYAIWFLVFIPFLTHRKIIVTLSLVLTFGLLLGYIPYMIRQTYEPPTLLLKTALTFTPAVLTGMYLLYKKYA